MNVMNTKTLLLVDDDIDVLTAVRRTLSREGYEILWTTNPHVACAMIETNAAIDLLVSDIDMPEMDGLELVKRCRQARPEIIRMIVSGHGTAEAVTRALNEGEVHRFIHKPFSPAELREVIASALSRQSQLTFEARAAQHARHRREALAKLERAYPGVTEVAFESDGAYRIDADAAGDIEL